MIRTRGRAWPALAAALVLTAALTACGSTGSAAPTGTSAGDAPGITATAALGYTTATGFYPVAGAAQIASLGTASGCSTSCGPDWQVQVTNNSAIPFDFGSWVLVFWSADGRELLSQPYTTEQNPATGLSEMACAATIMPGQTWTCGDSWTYSTAPPGTARVSVAEVTAVPGVGG